MAELTNAFNKLISKFTVLNKRFITSMRLLEMSDKELLNVIRANLRFEFVNMSRRTCNQRIEDEKKEYEKRTANMNAVAERAGVVIGEHDAVFNFYEIHNYPIDVFIERVKKVMRRQGRTNCVLKMHDPNTELVARLARLEAMIYDVVILRKCTYEEFNKQFVWYPYRCNDVVNAFKAAGFQVLAQQHPKGNYPRTCLLFFKYDENAGEDTEEIAEEEEYRQLVDNLLEETDNDF